MRDTPPEQFRQLAGRISVLLAAEALRDVADSRRDGRHAARAGTWAARERRRRAGAGAARGTGMLPGMLELVPGARVGHIGLQRDERTALASRYYSKLPPRLETATC